MGCSAHQCGNTRRHVGVEIVSARMRRLQTKGTDRSRRCRYDSILDGITILLACAEAEICVGRRVWDDQSTLHCQFSTIAIVLQKRFLLDGVFAVRGSVDKPRESDNGSVEVRGLRNRAQGVEVR